jgi:hypothetical protein
VATIPPDPVPAQRSVPLGLLGMLVLILAVERTISRNDLDFVEENAWQYRLARAEAADNASGREILVFGDSLAKMGIAPSVIKRRAGSGVVLLAQENPRERCQAEGRRRRLFPLPAFLGSQKHCELFPTPLVLPGEL